MSLEAALLHTEFVRAPCVNGFFSADVSPECNDALVDGEKKCLGLKYGNLRNSARLSCVHKCTKSSYDMIDVWERCEQSIRLPTWRLIGTESCDFQSSI